MMFLEFWNVPEYADGADLEAVSQQILTERNVPNTVGLCCLALMSILTNDIGRTVKYSVSAYYASMCYYIPTQIDHFEKISLFLTIISSAIQEICWMGCVILCLVHLFDRMYQLTMLKLTKKA